MLNLPYNDISPIFHLTPYEIELFNTDFTKEIFEYTLANQLSVKNDYKEFISGSFIINNYL